MKHNRNTFYCFSPPVMLATFAVEIGLVVYTIWRYRLSAAVRLVVAILIFLAFFQLAEYFVCGGLGINSRQWSRAGYFAISTLPPLGLHLLHVISGKPGRKLVGLSYLTAAGFIAYFLFDVQVFSSYVCAGNYVIFRIGSGQALAYGAFYYGWLATSLGLGVRWLNEFGPSKAKASALKRRAIAGLLTGYLVFLIPTAIVNTLEPDTTAGIPSIMCGFAVLFAVILVALILPNYNKARD